MTCNAINLHDISFILPHKTCFQSFTAAVPHGHRIALIGNNGCGKSTLLRILYGSIAPTTGTVAIARDVRVSYVPQVLEQTFSRAGAQQFNALLSLALADDPTLLLLDEPTNHLDQKNRASLKRMLASFAHSLVIASHDEDLLQTLDFDQIWHISDGSINVFHGSYENHIREFQASRSSVEREIGAINRAAKEAHESLMREQARRKSSRLMGEKSIVQRKWPTVVSNAKARRAETTSGKKTLALRTKREELALKLSELKMPEIVTPRFHLKADNRKSQGFVSVQQGTIGYGDTVLTEIHLSIPYGQRLAIKGENGAGKSTLLKALCQHPQVSKHGNWTLPSRENIGYIDQNYQNLDLKKSVFTTIRDERPDWSIAEIRSHLNDFLFRKNEEVASPVSCLSGGERARLSFCKIAALSPQILLLDEVTNNIDQTTRQHLIEVLKSFPGTMIIISHDENFLAAIDVHDAVTIQGGRLN